MPNNEPAPVVVRTDAAGAAECPDGGSAVSSGLDNNGDGVLGDAEVMNRSVVCRPAAMQAPPEVRVRLVAEPPGTHCSAGGTAVESGLDDNRNGVLDDREVAHIDYACGQVLLTRLAAEPPGANCSIGGVAFLAGRDHDGDGVLEDAEVEGRSFECGDVMARDVTIASEADVAALADVRIITGTVLADLAFKLAHLSLPKLEHIGGGLRILSSGGTPGMQVALPELQEVDGVFELRNSLVSQLDCAKLRRVGSLAISDTELTDVGGFPALTTVDGDVTLEFNALLVSADLPPLSVGGDVAIDHNNKLVSLTLKLQGRVGAVSMFGNTSAASIEVSVARRDGAPSQIGSLTIFGADALTHLAVSADRAASLTVDFNPQLTDVALDIASFDDDVTLFGIAGPFHVGLTPAGADHITIGGRLIVSSPLQSFDVAAPLTVGDLCVFDKTSLTRFAPGSPVTVGGGGRPAVLGQSATDFGRAADLAAPRGPAGDR